MTDRRTVLFVVIALSVLTAIALGGVIALLLNGNPAQDVIAVSGLASTGMGALAAMLVSTRSSGCRDPPVDPPAVTGTMTSTVTVSTPDPAEPATG